MTDDRVTVPGSILAAVRRAHRALAVDSEYARHAAPESIQAQLRDAQKARVALDGHIEWLTNLAGERVGQIIAGTWPDSQRAGQAQ